MVFEMQKIPTYLRLAALSAVIVAPLAYSPTAVHAQIAESDQPYTPTGRIFDANKDGSKIADGSRSEIETRADVYETEIFQKQLEAQARREYLRRFSVHDFNRPSGPYDDY